jgi:hypothetical protein
VRFAGTFQPFDEKGCAMSRTAGIATAGGRSSRQLTPRRTTYLDPKGGRDRSLLLKRGGTEDVDGAALQRLSATAKAGLPEPQCPGVESSPSSVARLYADARDSSRFRFRLEYALVEGRWLVKLLKGMSAEPTSLYTFLGDGTWDGLRSARARVTESWESGPTRANARGVHRAKHDRWSECWEPCGTRDAECQSGTTPQGDHWRAD